MISVLRLNFAFPFAGVVFQAKMYKLNSRVCVDFKGHFHHFKSE